MVPAGAALAALTVVGARAIRWGRGPRRQLELRLGGKLACLGLAPVRAGRHPCGGLAPVHAGEPRARGPFVLAFSRVCLPDG